jgi:hypothetical protein
MKKMLLIFTQILVLSFLFNSFTFAQSGNALRINPTSPPDYADGTGVSSLLTNITLETWVYISSVATSQRFITIGDEVAGIRGNNHDLNFFIKTGGTIQNLTVTSVLSSNKWLHVAGTWDGTTMRLYLNGKEIATSTPSGSLNSSDGTVKISDSGDDEFHGMMDEIRVWNDARTVNEIKDNMFQELTGTETGLEHYWKLNETGGTTAADAAGSVDLTLHNFGSGPWKNSGAFAGPKDALDFDGIDDFVSIPSNTSLNNSLFTVEFWVKMDVPESWNGIIDKGRNTNTDWCFLTGTSGLGEGVVFAVGTGTSVPELSYSWSDAAWHHVAGTFDGTNMILYVDGVQRSSRTASMSSTTNNITVGSRRDGSWSFDGKIDEVRIWNDVRSESEIRGNYCTALVGNESGLVGYWRFDQVADNRAPDQTGTNHGTLNNMADDDWIDCNAFNTWIGWLGNAWASSSLDWSLGTFPNSSTSVCIPEYVYITSSGNGTCKDLIVRSGEQLTIFDGRTCSAAGNVFEIGDITSTGNGKLKLTGGSATHNVSINTVENLELDDVNGAKLLRNSTFNTSLTLTNGDLDLNGFNITLGGSAQLTEIGGVVNGTSGTMQTTRSLDAPTSDNVGGLGATITSSADLGNTTIIRGHTAQSGGGNTSIDRYYDITPTNNTGLDATLVFNYDDSELSGKIEASLQLWKSTDGGSTWTDEGGVIDIGNNTITLSNVGSFSRWTATDADNPLPVELSSFTVEVTNQGVICKWTTESEIENLGFILERKTEGTEWEEIVSYKTDDGLLGQGSISSATDYEYIDVYVEPNTTYEYRLADVDYNGIVTYHATREVTVDQAPLTSKVEKFTVLPAYPNPFNPTTTIRYGIDTDSKVTVQIYDITGQLITTLLNTEQTQGWHSVVWNGRNDYNKQVPAGIYISKITSNNKVKTTKLMLLK